MKSAAPRIALLLVGAVLVSVAGTAVYPGWRPEIDPTHPAPVTAEDALAELRAGNARYVASHRTRSIDTKHDADDREELAKGQHPFAAVVCCSDSRVCPEFIFDQRPGSLFDIRNAGNVVDDDVMGSLEYAVEHLHVRVLLVLGHTGCGAIDAVHSAGDKPLHDHLRALQEHMACIRPQVQSTHDQHTPEVLDRLSAENARGQARTVLKESEPLAAAVGRGEVRLVCGLYDMRTGRVDLFDPD
jgi:carbonic anhydrase